MSQFLSYPELLATPTWREKRQQILYRDNYNCTKCGKKQELYIEESYNQHEWRINQRRCNVSDVPILFYLRVAEQEKLQIHHKIYRVNTCPILQVNDDLIVLCSECHERWHEENAIIVLDQNNKVYNTLRNCLKCNGKGNIPEYNHIEDGICFLCWGSGKVIPKATLNWTENDIDYPGIDYNLDIKEKTIIETIKFLKQLPSLKDFDIFLNKLHAVIEHLQVSSFDERFLIIIEPFPYENPPLDSYIKVRVGSQTFQAFPPSKYSIPVLGAFWEPSDIRDIFNDIIKEFEKDTEMNQDWCNAEKDYYKSRDFKDRHNHVIYKMAVNYDFRLKIFKELNLQ